jgi:hypothetical protein
LHVGGNLIRKPVPCSRAKIIVTQDDDLLALGKPFGIQITTPRELLVRLNSFWDGRLRQINLQPRMDERMNTDLKIRALFPSRKNFIRRLRWVVSIVPKICRNIFCANRSPAAFCRKRFGESSGPYSCVK